MRVNEPTGLTLGALPAIGTLAGVGSHTLPSVPALLQTQGYNNPHTHTHKRTHARTHAHTHTHTHTGEHIYTDA